MKKYAIYCTPEQTKTALELGAPIDRIECLASIGKYYISDNNHQIYDNGVCYFMPTAEEMMGWLEEYKIKEISIYGTNANKWNYDIWIKYGQQPITTSKPLYASRKEATIAAIDAALEYLENNRK